MLRMEQWRITASHERCANGAVRWRSVYHTQYVGNSTAHPGIIAPYYRPSPISPTHYGMHQLPPPRNLDETNSTEGTKREEYDMFPSWLYEKIVEKSWLCSRQDDAATRGVLKQVWK